MRDAHLYTVKLPFLRSQNLSHAVVGVLPYFSHFIIVGLRCFWVPQFLVALRDPPFKSYTEQYVDSLGPFSEAIIGLIGAIAEQERIRISERTKAGLARARRAGRLPGPHRMEIDVARVREMRAEGQLQRDCYAYEAVEDCCVEKTKCLAPRCGQHKRTFRPQERPSRIINQKELQPCSGWLKLTTNG